MTQDKYNYEKKMLNIYRFLFFFSLFVIIIFLIVFWNLHLSLKIHKEIIDKINRDIENIDYDKFIVFLNSLKKNYIDL